MCLLGVSQVWAQFNPSSLVVSPGATKVPQGALPNYNGGGGSNFLKKEYWELTPVGNISSATFSDNNFDININYKDVPDPEKGGAIIVKFSKNSQHYSYYVITVPYSYGEGNGYQHIWNFYNQANPTTGPAGNVDNEHVWQQVYKTTSSQGTQSYPVWAANPNATGDGHSTIDGNNAYYIPSTAGLVFNTADQRFGVDNDGNHVLTFGGNGSSFTIPQVPAGYYIRIWWNGMTEGGGRGMHFNATNVLDLDGVEITKGFIITGIADYAQGANLLGNTVFKVKEEGDVTFTLQDDYWNDIYKIQVMKDYDTDLILADGTAGWNNTHTVLYNNEFAHIVYKEGDGATTVREYDGSSAKSHCQRGKSCTFETALEPNTGWVTAQNVDWSFYHNLKLSNFTGTGNIKVIQRVSFPSIDQEVSYVLDKKESWIAVGTYKEQGYPYTWDFTDYNVGREALASAFNASPQYKYSDWDLIDSSDKRYGLETHALVDATTGPNGFVWNNVQIEKPLFAPGSQLTYGKANGNVGVIKETEGLRVKQRSASGLGIGEEFDKELSMNGYYLKFAPAPKSDHGLIITIPSIPQGEGQEDMWVFVKANAQPNGVWAATDKSVSPKLDPSTPEKCSLPEDVWAYQVTSAGDVEIYYQKDVEIQAIGVTNIFKSINLLGYATESRDVKIDHSYEGFFTNDDVNAYCILADEYGSPYEYKGTPIVVKSEQTVNVVPENTGIVLFKSGHDKTKGGFNVPLFYPACNVDVKETEQDLYDVNMMAPNVSRTEHKMETETKNGVKYTKFVMSRQYYIYHKNSDGTGTDSEEKESEQEAFYRMRVNSGVTGTSNWMEANKAYLLIPTDNLPLALWNNGNGQGVAGKAKPGVIFMDDIMDLFGGEEPISGIATAIDTIESTETVGNGYTFHTLSGMQIQGVPTQKGVYIVNGKKVLVK